MHGLPLAHNADLRENKRYLFDAVDYLERDAALDDASLEDLRRMSPVFDDDYAALLETPVP